MKHTPTPPTTSLALHGAVEVLLPIPADGGFDYSVPEGMVLHAGDVVRVPFGKREAMGMVVGAARGDVAAEKRKAVLGLAGEPELANLPSSLRALLDWVAWYTLSPKGMVLKMAMPDAPALQWTRGITTYRAAPTLAQQATAARKAAALWLTEQGAATTEAIAEHAHISKATVQQWVRSGLLEPCDTAPRTALPSPPEALPERPPLSGEQAAAAEQIRAALGNGFHTFLLDGVTGSGKTEVYWDSIARALDAGQQVMVLLPEIALALPWEERFAQRFGHTPAVWHSGISKGRKHAIWRGVRDGSVRLVVGARSALFLPFTQLGLVVVDEEHEASFKQEDGVYYHARDMAIARARLEGAVAILVSATPSMESYVNAHSGRYTPLHLRQRYGEATLPEVAVVDLRTEKMPSTQFLSQALKDALLHTYQAGHQSLVFLNRRGYAPLVLCRSCGHRFACPTCDAWLVYHRSKPRLQCHHCGHTEPAPTACPECKADDALVPFGPGVERVGEEVKALLPDARIGLMTSDALTTPAALKAMLARITEGSIDVVVGTQMIAKGHHFPGLALVGVVDADMGLASSDFRASERTFQLLHQVAGRAGRAAIRGRVLLQSFLPEHAVLQALAAYDRDRFLAYEAVARSEAGMPPYGRLLGVVVEGPDLQAVLAHAKRLAALAPHEEGVSVLGPAPAPLAMLRGQHRVRLLVKAPRTAPLQRYGMAWLHACPTPRNLRVRLDVDPYSFV